MMSQEVVAHNMPKLGSFANQTDPWHAKVVCIVGHLLICDVPNHILRYLDHMRIIKMYINVI